MKASVVIPTFNAGPVFRRLLDAVSLQDVEFEFEIVVVDSGSTDGTVELAEEYDARVHHIKQSEFNHGYTRNFGVSLSHGEYVVLTVQDAVPFDRKWLATMVENLDRDELVAGVYGRQIPHLDAGLLTKAVTNGQASASLERGEKCLDTGFRLDRLPPRKQRRLCAFDNVNSCIRRSVWEEIPFDKTDFGEDLRWGKKVVEAGHKLVYEPDSAVFHSHERGAYYDLRRHYVDSKILLELFGLRAAPSLAFLAPATFRSSASLYRLLCREGASGRLENALIAAEHTIPAQIGASMALWVPKVKRISPELYRILNRYLSKDT